MGIAIHGSFSCPFNYLVQFNLEAEVIVDVVEAKINKYFKAVGKQLSSLVAFESHD